MKDNYKRNQVRQFFPRNKKNEDNTRRQYVNLLEKKWPFRESEKLNKWAEYLEETLNSTGSLNPNNKNEPGIQKITKC